jgi:hypothetical protein
MFESDLPGSAVADLVVGAIDEAADSPRRWALLLVTALAAVLAVLWFAKRAATDDVVRVPDAGGPG